MDQQRQSTVRWPRWLMVVTGATVIVLSWLWAMLAGVPTTPPAHAQGPDEEIVYIDNEGRLRVLDPPDPGQVQWVSPAADGEWTDFDLGDFNGDGDFEIVAIRPFTTAGFNLAIYDPVIAPNDNVVVDQTQIINEIPWTRLYTTTIPGTLTAIAAGNLDASVAGDEIIFAYIPADTAAAAPVADRSSVQILRRDPAVANATAWQVQTPPIQFREEWRVLRAEDIDNAGNDEVAMIAESGLLAIYRVDGAAPNSSLTLLFENANRARPWLSVDIGQFYIGGPAEVAVVRHAPRDFPQFWVFEYAPSGTEFFRDSYAERFFPSPQLVFYADVNGSGDGELFLLREPPEASPPTPTPVSWPTLIMRNSGLDRATAFEPDLGRANIYRTGAGGDTDGDGRDEVVIGTEAHIRVFASPETSITATEYPRRTRNLQLRVADLNRSGYKILPRLVIAPAVIPAQQLPAGARSANAVSLALTSDRQDQQLTLAVALADAPPWLAVQPTSGTTPTTLRLSYDAYGQPPLTTLQTTLVITATSSTVQIANSSVRLPVTLSVGPGLYPQPSVIHAALACDPPTTGSFALSISGLLGVPFTAQIEPAGAATWLTLSADSSVLPTTLTLTFDTTAIVPGVATANATVQVNARNNQGQPIRIDIPVHLACARAYLPIVADRVE